MTVSCRQKRSQERQIAQKVNIEPHLTSLLEPLLHSECYYVNNKKYLMVRLSSLSLKDWLILSKYLSWKTCLHQYSHSITKRHPVLPTQHQVFVAGFFVCFFKFHKGGNFVAMTTKNKDRSAVYHFPFP